MFIKSIVFDQKGSSDLMFIFSISLILIFHINHYRLLYQLQQAYDWLDKQQRQFDSFDPERGKIFSYDLSFLPPLLDYGYRSSAEQSPAFCYLYQHSSGNFKEFECDY